MPKAPRQLPSAPTDFDGDTDSLEDLHGSILHALDGDTEEHGSNAEDLYVEEIHVQQAERAFPERAQQNNATTVTAVGLLALAAGERPSEGDASSWISTVGATGPARTDEHAAG